MNSLEKNMNLPIAHDCVTFVLYTLLRILYPAPSDYFKQPFKLKVLMQDADSFALICIDPYRFSGCNLHFCC